MVTDPSADDFIRDPDYPVEAHSAKPLPCIQASYAKNPNISVALEKEVFLTTPPASSS
jgi:hypothetical protein